MSTLRIGSLLCHWCVLTECLNHHQVNKWIAHSMVLRRNKVSVVFHPRQDFFIFFFTVRKEIRINQRKRRETRQTSAFVCRSEKNTSEQGHRKNILPAINSALYYRLHICGRKKGVLVSLPVELPLKALAPGWHSGWKCENARTIILNSRSEFVLKKDTSIGSTGGRILSKSFGRSPFVRCTSRAIFHVLDFCLRPSHIGPCDEPERQNKEIAHREILIQPKLNMNHMPTANIRKSVPVNTEVCMVYYSLKSSCSRGI